MLPTWEHFHRVKLDLPSNKSDIYLRIWADFFWNFGLGDKGFPKFTEQLAACITGQWTLDENSMATGMDNLEGVDVINTQSQVATQTVPMTFNASQLMYSGDGPLAYDSYSVSVEWENGLQDCSSGVGNPGSLGVTATFDLNLFPSSPNQVRLELSLTPDITENTTFAVFENGQCVGTTPFTSTFYEQDIDASHSDTQLTATHYYFVYLNTPVTYDLSGTSTYGGVVYQATEETTLTASQTQ